MVWNAGGDVLAGLFGALTTASPLFIFSRLLCATSLKLCASTSAFPGRFGSRKSRPQSPPDVIDPKAPFGQCGGSYESEPAILSGVYAPSL
jgi:hypothetical protein